MELEQKTCSMCDRVLVTSQLTAHSQFRKLNGIRFSAVCKECEALEKELGPEPKGIDPRVDARPFQQWLLDFVASFDGVVLNGDNAISAATFLGVDPSQFRRIFNQTTVSISFIDKVLTNSGRATNLWELLPESEQHPSIPERVSGSLSGEIRSGDESSDSSEQKKT